MRTLKIYVIVMSLWVLTPLMAESFNDESIQLRLGGYLLSGQNTDAKISKHGVGATVNLQDLFNMKTTNQVFRLDGHYRFNPKHRIEFAWYSINNTSHTDRDASFEWGDEAIKAQGVLSTYFDTDIYKLNYVYTFYTSPSVDLSLSAGLHITKIGLGFSGEFSVGDINVSASGKKDAAVTAPLPVVGVRMGYRFNDAWSVNYAVDYFFITLEGVTGSMSDALLTLDYRFSKYVGVGVGINSTRMRFEADTKDNKQLAINHDVSGGLVYATFRY